jgi:hypothetical protein
MHMNMHAFDADGNPPCLRELHQSSLLPREDGHGWPCNTASPTSRTSRTPDLEMPRYLFHGLCVETETPLAAVPADAARAPDIRVAPWRVGREGFDARSSLLESAPRLIDRVYPVAVGAPALRAISVEHGSAWLSMFFERVLFELDRESGELQRYVRSHEDLAFGELLQAGSYLATLSTLRGRAAHHASAVDLEALGGTVLVAAGSGQGKSSTAAALVLAGGRLRSDDVVTLIASDAGHLCESGSLALRMRQPIDGPLPETLRPSEQDSGDQRHLYHGTSAIPALSPVVAVLFPQLETTSTVMALERVQALDGFQRLAHEPRVGGVQDRVYQAARVAELTALCGRVPLRSVRLSIAGRDLAMQGSVLLELLLSDPELTAT